MNISVVMATYNGGRYLEEQIRSILNQTVKPAELIVCDDGSTDGTTTILEKFKAENKITYIANTERLGLIGNFKKVVSCAADGNYIALSDQDDLWMPYKLEKSLSALKLIDNGLPALVYSDLTYVDENDKELNKSFRNELGQDTYQHSLDTLLYGNFVNGCTALFNPALRAMFADMPNQLSLNHDGWFALAAFTFGNAMYINEPLVMYRRHNQNFSIDVNLKPKNRYRSLIEQLIRTVNGKDDFLKPQFDTVNLFYNQYAEKMPAEKRLVFEQFLQLQKKSYLVKKLAFRKMVTDFKL
jgi:glycosyltransferase involved in cell wall biosynthesis